MAANSRGCPGCFCAARRIAGAARIKPRFLPGFFQTAGKIFAVICRIIQLLPGKIKKFPLHIIPGGAEKEGPGPRRK